MGGDEKDGYYCAICGGIPPDQIKIKKITIDGKETGIDRLDWILLDVYRRNFAGDETVTDELIKRVRQFNYIPTMKMAEYRRALLREFKMLRPDDIRLLEVQQEEEQEKEETRV